MAGISYERTAPLLSPGGRADLAGSTALAAAPHEAGRTGDSPCCSVEQLHETLAAVDTLTGMIGLIILALALGMRLLS